MVRDNSAHDAKKFAVADVAAALKLEREMLQELIPAWGTEWSRKPEKLIELAVAKGKWHWTLLSCAACSAAR